MRFRGLACKPVPSCWHWPESCMTTVTQRGVNMQLFRDLSIRHKLQAIVITACGVALVVAAAVFTLYDRTTFLRAKTDDLIASAKIIGSHTNAARAFQATIFV